VTVRIGAGESSGLLILTLALSISGPDPLVLALSTALRYASRDRHGKQRED
jgi:hypothetical protein